MLNQLKNLHINELHDINVIEETLHEVFDYLANDNRIMKTNSSLIGVAKTLHHFLPYLLMPVDRKYIINLLHQIDDIDLRPALQWENFITYWRCIKVSHRLADLAIEHIDERTMDTSITKVIDNSLIGMSMINFH